MKKNKKAKRNKNSKKMATASSIMIKDVIRKNINVSKTATVLELDDEVTGYNLCDIAECFPNITTLKIGYGIKIIKMRNRTFPNVRKVISESKYFQDDATMLISIDADEKGYCNKTLLNAFCRKSDDILDLNNINTISGMALDGCMAQKVINVECLEKLADDALLGSYFESLDGVIMFDSCLVGVNGENLSFELTNSIEKILPGGLFHGRIKELIVKDFTLLRLLQDHIDAPFCDTIHIYVGGHTREEVQLSHAAEKNKLALSCRHVLLSSSNNEELKRIGCENDILYTPDGDWVITGSTPWFMTGAVTFPEKTWAIGSRLESENIESIYIPKDVKVFFLEAFASHTCRKKLSSIICDADPSGFRAGIPDLITIVPYEVDKKEEDWISVTYLGRRTMIPRYITEEEFSEITF